MELRSSELFSGGGLQRREGPGFALITPEQLSQIDFSQKSDISNIVLIVSGIVIALLGTVVPLRLWIRKRVTGRWFLDDFLVIFATIFTLVVCACSIAGTMSRLYVWPVFKVLTPFVATKSGLGKHIWNLDFLNIFTILKNCIQLMFVGNIFYALAITFTKLSIIASYMHIFNPHGYFRWLLYGTAGVTIGLGIAAIPTTVLQCRPLVATWDFSLPRDGCFRFVTFLYASTAINITTDLILCTAPIPSLWALQLPRRQKILISVLFFLGGLYVTSVEPTHRSTCS
jgi:hypothetical protein